MNLFSGFGAPPAGDGGGAGWLHAEAPLPSVHGGVVPGAVHQIRGSLTVLLVGAELAARPDADPAQRDELLQGMRAAVRRIDGSLEEVRAWLERAGGAG